MAKICMRLCCLVISEAFVITVKAGTEMFVCCCFFLFFFSTSPVVVKLGKFNPRFPAFWAALIPDTCFLSLLHDRIWWAKLVLPAAAQICSDGITSQGWS